MDNSNITVPIRPFFGGFVLETLTIGMYGQARNAIREYIQNGFDSIQRAVSERLLVDGDGRIDIELAVDHDSIVIRDNGTGIATEDALEVLTRVGASSKDHRRHAGFRGIGRLAGIAFSDTVSFRTSAFGEHEQTTVVFDARRMREQMAPNHASALSAEDLLISSVTAHRSRVTSSEEHFLEVRLEGLRDAPKECTSLSALTAFVSQVAPVPYNKDFPFVERLRQAAKETNIPIDEVCVTVREGDATGTPIFKPYAASHSMGPAMIPLTDCEICTSPTGSWWGWVGKKAASGAYTDAAVAGIRVRVRNIQIDDTELIRSVFRQNSASHERFQNYFVGEIFVRPGTLVPNARRDSFEEDQAWTSFFQEISPVTAALAREAYAVSKQDSLSVTSLRTATENAKRRFDTLRVDGFSDLDGTIGLSKSITTVQRRVERALRDATLDATGSLNVIGSELLDMKQEAISQLGGDAFGEDRERLQQETREEMLGEILFLFESKLPPPCFTRAREALFDEYGDP